MSRPPKPEQVLSEPAGARMDRWVGTLIMGLRVRRRGGGRREYDLVGPGVNREGFADEGSAWAACPAYSEDLAAALQVAEASISNIELRRIRHPDGRWQWMAHLRFTEATGAATAAALPLAICRAALLSKLGGSTMPD